MTDTNTVSLSARSALLALGGILGAALLAPSARAQTLTVEVEATAEVRTDPRGPSRPPAASPGAARPDAPRSAERGQRGPLVWLRPLDEADARRSPASLEEAPGHAPQPPPALPPPPTRPHGTHHHGMHPRGQDGTRQHRAPAPPPRSQGASTEPEDPHVEGWVAVTGWGEALDLSAHALELGSPEVEALQGARLEPGWAGGGPLSAHGVGGLALGFGVRLERFVRGPEIRLYLGGGSASGPWASVPGDDSGLELSVQRSFVARAEAAFGLQAELGPLVPYVQLIGSAGGALVELAVRDPDLGRLGSETVATGLLGLGLEAGFGVRTGDGLEVGLALRGNFLGTPSLGLALSLGAYGGE